MTSSTKSYVQGFDGLRGIAILLVLLHHIELFHKWRVGPEIFFVLSGYLTTRSLQGPEGIAIAERLATFYRRRVLRLTPPLLALLAVVIPVMALMPDIDEDVLRDVLAAANYSMNWQQALTLWESHDLAHLWTLAAEQQFYLIWPPIFLLCPRGWIKPLLVAVAGAAVACRFCLYAEGASFNRIYFGLDTHADGLVVGCLLALTTVPSRLVPVLRHAGLVSLAVMTIAALVLPEETVGALCASITLTTVLAALTLTATRLGGGLLERVLELPPLQAVGRMSYSIYLWNFPVIALCHPHLHHGLKALQLAVLGTVSTVNYALIEKPLARYLRVRRPAAAERPAGIPAREPSRAWSPVASASQGV